MSGIFGVLRRNSVLVGNIGLVLVMVVGLGYLSLGVLRWEPFADKYSLTIQFPISGGLQETSGVTLRGARIGDVDTVRVQPDSVEVTVTVDDRYKINRNTVVAALGLSAAGEQYVDFQPSTSEGPYLENGDVIKASQTEVTVPFSQLLESSLELIDQIDPAKLRSAVDNLNIALNTENGTNDLEVIFDAGGTIFADLYTALPETTKLIQNAGTVFKTTAQIQPDFGGTVSSLSALINSAAASDTELRTLLDRGPAQFTSLAGSINQLTDPVTDVMKQFLDIAQQGALRAPALATLLPAIRDASVKSLAMFHDGAWWAFGSVYPRPSCNYPVTPRRPTQILELTIPTNLYCVTEDPRQQIRGSANAPRPPGDDTAGPPPGYDPNARTVPLDK
ncbi:MCE family protein [Gordonia sp. zg691]|uniref:MCE family protein n=1 Tax=Gordonia jinghuaiqii TaxID=2758710 RepID=A0A7D7LS51_9ACTN|nr:MlaD family protein [Gordonia jinghuaiqii]MBD0860124.1 MCE family protein [Gordonia jinghuaiqii]MCR5977291.1 MCE family protein [Gordonia jinghuaiqii]QMT00121.1 MCE family protein [Gordonia jinghuaiqii]